jgi:hypothetical protein
MGRTACTEPQCLYKGDQKNCNFISKPQQERCPLAPFLVALFYINGSVSSINAMTSSLYACMRCHTFCKSLQSTISCIKLNCRMLCHCIAVDCIATRLRLVQHESCYTYVFIRASSIFVLLASFIRLGDFLHNC